MRACTPAGPPAGSHAPEPEDRPALDQLPAEANAIEPDRPVVFYCRMGSRSALATGAFRAAGFDAYNLDGGLLAWVESGLPIEPEGGSVAPH